MATQIRRNVPQIVHGTEAASATTQTRGMVRRPAIHSESVGASKIWFGTVTCDPNQKGPPSRISQKHDDNKSPKQAI